MTDSPLPTPRDCGGCTMCCKLIGVPAMEKPPGQWCSECEIAVGCKIHETRPQMCRDFLCAWAQGIAPLNAKPDRTRVVLSWTLDGKYPVAYVYPERPDAWKKEPLGSWLDNMATILGRVFIVCGNKRYFLGWDHPPSLKQFMENLPT